MLLGVLNVASPPVKTSGPVARYVPRTPSCFCEHRPLRRGRERGAGEVRPPRPVRCRPANFLKAGRGWLCLLGEEGRPVPCVLSGGPLRGGGCHVTRPSKGPAG